MKRLLCIVLLCWTSLALGQTVVINSFPPVPAEPPPAGGATYLVGHVRAAIASSSGNQDFTIAWSDGSTGNTPDCAFFIMTRATTDATAADHRMIALGAASGTSARWSFATHSESGQTTTNTDVLRRDNGAVSIMTTSGGVGAYADLSSFGSDTVTISWDQNPEAQFLLHITAFADTDGCVAGTFTPAGSDAGTVDVTTLGATANFVWGIGAARSFTPGIQQHGGWESMGFYTYDGTTARNMGTYQGSYNNLTTSSISAGYWDDAMVTMRNNNSTPTQFTVTLSAHASGFTATSTDWSNSCGTCAMAYLAIDLPDGDEAYVGTATTPTSTGDMTLSGMGWESQAVALITTMIDAASGANESDPPDNEGTNYGVAISTTSEYSLGTTDRDNQTTTDSQSRSESALLSVFTGAGTQSLACDADAFGATSITLDCTTVDATARRVVYVAFQK